MKTPNTQTLAALAEKATTGNTRYDQVNAFNALKIACNPEAILAIAKQQERLVEALEESTSMLTRIAQNQDWGAIEDQIRDNQAALAGALENENEN